MMLKAFDAIAGLSRIRAPGASCRRHVCDTTWASEGASKSASIPRQRDSGPRWELPGAAESADILDMP